MVGTPEKLVKCKILQVLHYLCLHHTVCALFLNVLLAVMDLVPGVINCSLYLLLKYSSGLACSCSSCWLKTSHYPGGTKKSDAVFNYLLFCTGMSHWMKMILEHDIFAFGYGGVSKPECLGRDDACFTIFDPGNINDNILLTNHEGWVKLEEVILVSWALFGHSWPRYTLILN